MVTLVILTWPAPQGSGHAGHTSRTSTIGSGHAGRTCRTSTAGSGHAGHTYRTSTAGSGHAGHTSRTSTAGSGHAGYVIAKIIWSYGLLKIWNPARGIVGRVTDCGVRGLGFKSPGSILISRTETSSLSRVVRDGWHPCSVPLSGVKKRLMLLSLRLGRWTAKTVQKTTPKITNTVEFGDKKKDNRIGVSTRSFSISSYDNPYTFVLWTVHGCITDLSPSSIPFILTWLRLECFIYIYLTVLKLI